MGAAAAPLPGSTAEGEMMPPATGEGNESEVLQTVSGRLSMLFLGTIPLVVGCGKTRGGGIVPKMKKYILIKCVIRYFILFTVNY